METELTKFLETFPLQEKIGKFNPEHLKKLEDVIPKNLLDFLSEWQKSIFGNRFFYTISPIEYGTILECWGLDHSTCYAFLRSSFGSIVYLDLKEETCFSLDPYVGEKSVLGGKNIIFVLNLILTYDFTLDDGFYWTEHENFQKKLPALKDDEIYTFDPHILDTDDQIKISDIKSENIFKRLEALSNLFGNKLTEN